MKIVAKQLKLIEIKSNLLPCTHSYIIKGKGNQLITIHMTITIPQGKNGDSAAYRWSDVSQDTG